MEEATKIQTLKDDEKAQWLRDFESIEGNDTVPPWQRKLRMDRARMIDDIYREHQNRLWDAAQFLEDGLYRADNWYHEEMAKMENEYGKP